MLSQIFWAANHRKQIKELMKGKAIIMNGPLNYNQDGLATRHNADFMQEPAFRQAYDGTWGEGSEKIHWRAYTQCWAARHGLNLEGDFVECGVERGRSAKMVMEYLEFENSPKRYWLLDTFCGLDDAQVSPAERERGIIEFSRERYHDCYDEVCKTFAQYPNVEIVRGVVPETLSRVKAEMVAYLSIDMNCAAPEIAAAEYFWPKMSSGAIMLLDDYGWRMHFEQKVAFDQFAKRHNISILPLPTGQAIIIKP